MDYLEYMWKSYGITIYTILISEDFAQCLKGYCTVFRHALKLMELTGIDLTERMSKTARKNLKGLKSYKEFKF